MRGWISKQTATPSRLAAHFLPKPGLTSAIVRSLLKKPLPAVDMMDILVHWALSRYTCAGEARGQRPLSSHRRRVGHHSWARGSLEGYRASKRPWVAATPGVRPPWAGPPGGMRRLAWSTRSWVAT